MSEEPTIDTVYKVALVSNDEPPRGISIIKNYRFQEEPPFITSKTTPQIPNNRKGRRMNKRKKK